MRNVVAVVLILMLCAASLFVWTGERAYACSCVNSTAKQRLKTHSAVFAGKVVDIGGGSIFSSQQYKAYTLDVDTAWKGVDAKQMTILISDMGEAACGTTLEKDQMYLIFAYKDEKDGKLRSSLCSFNTRLEHAEEAAEILGKGTPVSSGDFRFSSGSQSPWMIVFYAGGTVVLLGLAGGWLWRRKRR
ncbi:hypothetical protein HUB98_10175 [Paenibacillus barcinonensis]|uniref:Putative secreted protein with PEP-CTERM sorting signal/MYXO-CTERM domain-containing protein n=1 Tax=Paenibacillus barcinonensis TaxID=198119 RepID=A0A2V4WP44_PAEBA|nr:hypothetical protein [Paenibacillus barcinonensis]PYE49622.1 putative secreted protein with PEP-CTERM sorting signal/MYXO-CTERM domain-containing protein [Paenibacillus barcinonensis]QKS56668.1 hypothetical protein HUB98_10175 [Paenibacillus barcinonensis]